MGIGHIFSTEIASLYKKLGFRFIITSSTKSLFKQRKKDPRWIITSKKQMSKHGGTLQVGKFGNYNKISFSYEYIGT